MYMEHDAAKRSDQSPSRSSYELIFADINTILEALRILPVETSEEVALMIS